MANVLPADVLTQRRWFNARFRVPDAVLAGAIALIAIAVASHLRSTTYDNYTRLAYSILHGHLWIDWPGRSIEIRLKTPPYAARRPKTSLIPACPGSGVSRR